MEGHIFSVFPTKGKSFTIDTKSQIFPMLSLLVSGGHTELVLIKDWSARAGGMKYKKIGQTRDDAVGEAFDKVARMLGLPYPGGPEISRLADIERKNLIPLLRGGRQTGVDAFPPPPSGTPQEENKFQLPRPMIHSKDYDFSFSGLKTAVLYLIRDLKNTLDENMKRKIAKEFEDSAIEVLVYKTSKAIKEYKIKTLIVGGGVSANEHLKQTLTQSIKKIDKNIKVHFPIKSLSTDNALMISVSAYFQYEKKKPSKNLDKIVAKGNLSL
jgi:N6-L-threonylcarbamoyladenine synthase